MDDHLLSFFDLNDIDLNYHYQIILIRMIMILFY